VAVLLVRSLWSTESERSTGLAPAAELLELESGPRSDLVSSCEASFENVSAPAVRIPESESLRVQAAVLINT